MQVCTQPQICDERPHWEPRPYLTHVEPPPHTLAPPLSLFPSLLSAFKEEGAATQKKKKCKTSKVGSGRLQKKRKKVRRWQKKRKEEMIRSRESGRSVLTCSCSRVSPHAATHPRAPRPLTQMWHPSCQPLPPHTPSSPNPHPYHQPSPPNSSITICMAPLAPDYANHLSGPCSP